MRHLGEEWMIPGRRLIARIYKELKNIRNPNIKWPNHQIDDNVN